MSNEEQTAALETHDGPREKVALPYGAWLRLEFLFGDRDWTRCLCRAEELSLEEVSIHLGGELPAVGQAVRIRFPVAGTAQGDTLHGAVVRSLEITPEARGPRGRVVVSVTRIEPGARRFIEALTNVAQL